MGHYSGDVAGGVRRRYRRRLSGGASEAEVYEKWHIPRGFKRDRTTNVPLSEPQAADLQSQLDTGAMQAWQVPDQLLKQLALRWWNRAHPWMPLPDVSALKPDHLDAYPYWWIADFGRVLGDLKPPPEAAAAARLADDPLVSGIRSGVAMAGDAAASIPVVGNIISGLAKGADAVMSWGLNKDQAEIDRKAAERRRRWEESERRSRPTREWMAEWGATGLSTSQLDTLARQNKAKAPFTEDQLAGLEEELSRDRALAWAMPAATLEQLAYRWWNRTHGWEKIEYPGTAEQTAKIMQQYPYNYNAYRPDAPAGPEPDLFDKSLF